MSTENRGEFGKDLGLIHQVILAGREIGADATFWAFLAYDKKVFAQVVELVKDARVKWLTLSETELKTVQEWLKLLKKNDCPYPEDETYYTRSSHSTYNDRLGMLYRGDFQGMFRKASQSKQVADLCKLIEACFVVSYLLSGYYSAEQDVEGTKREWMHGPFSITTYFHDIWRDDPRVPVGNFFSNEDFRKIEMAEEVLDMTQKDQGWGKTTIHTIVPKLRIIKENMIKLLEEELAKLS